jgi:hypothetical protein
LFLTLSFGGSGKVWLIDGYEKGELWGRFYRQFRSDSVPMHYDAHELRD